jgi:DNA-binding MarR family transcriptional regulator
MPRDPASPRAARRPRVEGRETAAPAPARPRREIPLSEIAARIGVDGTPDWLAYIPRGRNECAYSNVRLATRVIGAIYDDALRPVGLRAAQLALLWAIVAMEPVDLTSLGRETATDQTTLSRTVENLRRQRLVSVQPGEDRRVKVIRLTNIGKLRFAAAMPYWERAQVEAARVLSLDALESLGRSIRRARRAAT